MVKIHITEKGEKIIEGDVKEVTQLWKELGLGLSATGSTTPIKSEEQIRITAPASTPPTEKVAEAVKSGRAEAESIGPGKKTAEIPSVEAVTKFLESKGGDFRHTLREIQMNCLGKVYRSWEPGETEDYNLIYYRSQYARGRLQKKYGGAWKRKKIGRESEYWLEKIPTEGG